MFYLFINYIQIKFSYILPGTMKYMALKSTKLTLPRVLMLMVISLDLEIATELFTQESLQYLEKQDNKF